MHKLMVVVHALVFALGLFEAKSAGHSSHSMFFKRPMERKKTEPDEQRSDMSKRREVNGSFSLRLGVEKVVF